MRHERLTRIVRERRPGLLENDLVELVTGGAEQWRRDPRDLMVALAPYHHCAARLGEDVPVLFARVAAAGPPDLRETVETFGRRTDVTPASWLFDVEDAPDGPAYVRRDL